MATLTTTVQERIALPAPAEGAAGEGGGSPTATDILAMLRRRAVLILVLFTLFTGLALGGFAVWWEYFPGYRSEALIECISNIPDAGLTVEQQRLKQDEHERFVMTQAFLLKSPSILGEALKVTAVKETKWYESVPPDEYLLELTEELSAAPVRGTNFLRVAIECRHPKDARVIVNEVVNQWFHSVKKRSAEEFADEALDAAQQEMANLENEIDRKRKQLRDIADVLPAGAVQDPDDNIINQQVKQYAEEAARLKLELAQLKQFRDIYNDPEGVAVTAEDRAAIEQNPQVAELARALLLLEQQWAAAAKVYGDEHTVLKRLDAQIAAVEAKLEQLRKERLGERRADLREAANTAYYNTLHAFLLAQENLLAAEAALQDQDRRLFDYYNLDAELTRKLENQNELSEYIKAVSRIKTQRTAIRVNVAQPAIDPLERSTPSLLLIPVGIFLALVLSGGIALGLELLDKSVRTSQDIVRYLNVVLLGLVPHTDDEEVTIERVETAVRDAPHSMVAEAFRRIRTNLQFSAPVERQRTVLITSPWPDDGKTTVACNLAISVAQGGRRVLLVDANFRRPGVSHIFENDKTQGLSNLLLGNGSLSSCAVQTSIPLLDVLGSGPTPPNPVELLGSERCRAFLQEAMSRYDQIIIDTAPALLASDAPVLATAVDGVVLVVRANLSSRGVARRACTLLADVGAHLFGAVLNAAQVTRGGYFREQLRTYYDYQANTKETGPIRTRPSKGTPVPKRPDQSSA